MKLSELLEQCESYDSSVCLAAKRRLRYHAAEVLPELVEASREFKYSVLLNGMASLKLISRMHNALKAAEEIQNHSEQLTPNTKPQTVTMP